MSAKRGEKPNLGAISGFPTVPSDEPDDLTKGEREQASRDANKGPTPTQLHDAALNKHIDYACLLRDRLDAENKQLQDKLDGLQGELDRLRPDHARLEEQFSNSRSLGDLSTLLLTVGAAAVSAASYHDLKIQILWLGYGLMVAGLSAFFCNKWRSRG